MLFAPDNIPTSADVLSSPLRNNFNRLVTMLNAGLTDDQFNDNTLSGTKLKDATIPPTKLTQFTAWTAWTPTITSTGGTFTSTSAPLARYCQIGKVCFVEISILGTAAGNLVIVSFTPPIAPATTTRFLVNGGAAILDGTGTPRTATAFYNWTGSDSNFSIQREGQAVMAAGSTRVGALLAYEVA